MSGFIENRASGASERSGPPDRVLTWQASRAMLPLVARIAEDVMRLHDRLGRMAPEFAALEKNRLVLTWPGRSRRYQLEEDIAAAQAEMRSLLAELEGLGVVVLDSSVGLVGFPTMVNEKRAFFSWQPGEEGLLYWNYADDFTRRPVPDNWTEPPRERPARKQPRPRKK
jgi:hypothetical protein